MIACACPACESWRAAHRTTRWVVYGDGMRPAWNVPLTPENDALRRAYSAVCHAHPHEAVESLFGAGRERWERMLEVTP